MTARTRALVAAGIFLAGAVDVFLLYRVLRPPAARVATLDPELVSKLDDLAEKVTLLRTDRCIQVKTSRLDLAVYPTTDLGTAPAARKGRTP